MQTNKVKPEQIIPTGKSVKVEIIIPKEIKTESGIFLADSNQKNIFNKIEFYEAEVLELGEKVKTLTENKLNPGDYVLLNKFAGFGIPTIGDKYIKVVEHSMIIGKKTNKKEQLNMEKLKPRFERILVKMEPEKNEVTEAGIIVPNKQKSIFDSELVKGTVVSVADDVEGISPGEKIIFENSVGTPMNTDYLSIKEGEHRMILKYDVIALIKN